MPEKRTLRRNRRPDELSTLLTPAVEDCAAFSDPRPVGIFDSGLGGLTVAAAVRAALPREKIIYLGDTARVPYGNRSAETILAFAEQDMMFLLQKNVKAIVAACNTVSATAGKVMRAVEQSAGIPVCGVIEPGAEAAAQNSFRTVAVLGTRATVRSGAYKKALLRRNPALQIIQLECPLFVPMIEEGILDGPLAGEVIRYYLEDLRLNPPGAVLLGCTHYPLLKHAIDRFFGGKTLLIDSAEVCALHLKKFLAGKGLAAPDGQKGSLELFASDITSGFREQAARFLGETVPKPGKAMLDV